ncbi:MAG: ABC transporter permease [Actinobacteria bacterium]|nr:ABC transporter permease [Actinomycetota bacterium]
MTSPDVSVAPAGVVATQSALRAIRSGFAWVGFISVYLFLYAPLVTIGIFAFNDSKVQALPWSGFTLQWFAAIGQDGLLLGAVTFGLSVSILVVLVASVVGTYFAVVVNSVRGVAPRVLLAAVMIPAIVPGMVLGLSLAITFRLVGIPAGLWSIVIGHLAFTVPVVTLVVLTRLRRLDPSLAQASMDLGANSWRTFWHVTFPQLRTAILAAALLTMTLSFDEVVITFFLVGTQQTLPLFIWSQTRFGFTPEINAIVTLIGGQHRSDRRSDPGNRKRS